MDHPTFLRTLVGLLAIVDPLGAIPLFLVLTRGRPPEERRAVAGTTALAVAVSLIGVLLAGDALLAFFGIRVASFRVAAGILVLLMAVPMLQAQPSGTRQTPAEEHESEERTSVAIIPLAIPMLAGPGAMSMVIVEAQTRPAALDRLYLAAAIALVSLCVWIALRLAEPISRCLGVTGINIVTRILGLLLVAVGVEFIAGGLAELLPGLAGP